jgi:hypothetical protein
MPGLKFCLAATAAESNNGSWLSEQLISLQAHSRESAASESSDSTRALEGQSIKSICPAPTMTKFYIRKTWRTLLGTGTGDVIKL